VTVTKAKGRSEPVRCEWAVGTTPRVTAYHDEEWGAPKRDPHTLFEFLILEGAQAGLSWRTILDKREGYRAAFAGFDPAVVATFDEHDIERLLADPGIVRNRAKIRATVGNARAWCELDDPVAFLWDFVGGRPLQNRPRSLGELPATTEVSERMSKELKRRGFRFVGGTICYSLMQACGLVNDHVMSCFRQRECAALA
jgi:DNA-3-methyladenine glycosylase I